MTKTFRSVRRVSAVQWQPGAKHPHVRDLAESWQFDARGEPDARGPVIAVLFSSPVFGGDDMTPIRRWDWIVTDKDRPGRPYRMSHEDFQREFEPGARP